MALAYTLNEEIVRQTLEVKFTILEQPEEWFICFSNPTAGPWKRILYLKKGGKEVKIGSYEKKEIRPDLIVVSKRHNILIIIEAKDYLTELLRNSQKIQKTFEKEIRKLSLLPILKDDYKHMRVLRGLVFYSDNTEHDYNEIKKKYDME